MKALIYTILAAFLAASAVAVPKSCQNTPGIVLRALGEIETGDNDFAIGHTDERGRFQMTPTAFHEVMPNGNPAWLTNLWLADYTLQRLMARREMAFHRQYGVWPDLRQYSQLWHAPARVKHPTSADLDYQKRFLNLFHRFQLPHCNKPNQGKP